MFFLLSCINNYLFPLCSLKHRDAFLCFLLFAADRIAGLCKHWLGHYEGPPGQNVKVPWQAVFWRPCEKSTQEKILSNAFLWPGTLEIFGRSFTSSFDSGLNLHPIRTTCLMSLHHHSCANTSTSGSRSAQRLALGIGQNELWRCEMKRLPEHQKCQYIYLDIFQQWLQKSWVPLRSELIIMDGFQPKRTSWRRRSSKGRLFCPLEVILIWLLVPYAVEGIFGPHRTGKLRAAWPSPILLLPHLGNELVLKSHSSTLRQERVHLGIVHVLQSFSIQLGM